MSSEIKIKTFFHDGRLYSLVYDTKQLKLPPIPDECKKALDTKIHQVVEQMKQDPTSALSKLSFEQSCDPRFMKRINQNITKQLEGARLETALAYFKAPALLAPPPSSASSTLVITPLDESLSVRELKAKWEQEYLTAEQKTQLAALDPESRSDFIQTQMKENLKTCSDQVVDQLVNDLKLLLKNPRSLLDLTPTTWSSFMELIAQAHKPAFASSSDVYSFLLPKLSSHTHFKQNLDLLLEKGISNSVLKDKIDAKLSDLQPKRDIAITDKDSILEKYGFYNPTSSLGSQIHFLKLLKDYFKRAEDIQTPHPWSFSESLVSDPRADNTWHDIDITNHHLLVGEVPPPETRDERLEELKTDFKRCFTNGSFVNLHLDEKVQLSASAEDILENLAELSPSRQWQALQALIKTLKDPLRLVNIDPLLKEPMAKVLNLVLTESFKGLLIETSFLGYENKDDKKLYHHLYTQRMILELADEDSQSFCLDAFDILPFSREEAFLGLLNKQEADLSASPADLL